jgi:CMP/dCMP kinase
VIIAVDGPAAAGKGTVARAVARHFGYHFLDTGSLYRRVALALLRQPGTTEDREMASDIAERIDSIPFADEELRTETVAQLASIVAAMPEVRQSLRAAQQHFAAKPPGAVLDGRDIGTVVCPDADAKLFVTANIQVRTERRLAELLAGGQAADYATVHADIMERDNRDRMRPVSPLMPAADAYVLDTSSLSIEEAVAAAIAHVKARAVSRR